MVVVMGRFMVVHGRDGGGCRVRVKVDVNCGGKRNDSGKSPRVRVYSWLLVSSIAS